MCKVLCPDYLIKNFVVLGGHDMGAANTGGGQNKLYTPPISITHCAVQAQCDQHQEKDDGEERGCRHVGNSLSIRDEEEAGSWVREQGRRKRC